MGSAGGLGSVAVAVDVSGGDTCRVDGFVVYGIDREKGEAGPDDAEPRDAPSVDGDDDRPINGDDGPANLSGCIAEVAKEICADANDFDKRGSPGGNGRGIADAGMEGTMGSGVGVEPGGDDFVPFAAVPRTFLRSYCCTSSLLRAFGGSYSS